MQRSETTKHKHHHGQGVNVFLPQTRCKQSLLQHITFRCRCWPHEPEFTQTLVYNDAGRDGSVYKYRSNILPDGTLRHSKAI